MSRNLGELQRYFRVSEWFSPVFSLIELQHAVEERIATAPRMSSIRTLEEAGNSDSLIALALWYFQTARPEISQREPILPNNEGLEGDESIGFVRIGIPSFDRDGLTSSYLLPVLYPRMYFNLTDLERHRCCIDELVDSIFGGYNNIDSHTLLRKDCLFFSPYTTCSLIGAIEPYMAVSFIPCALFSEIPRFILEVQARLQILLESCRSARRELKTTPHELVSTPEFSTNLTRIISTELKGTIEDLQAVIEYDCSGYSILESPASVIISSKNAMSAAIEQLSEDLNAILEDLHSIPLVSHSIGEFASTNLSTAAYQAASLPSDEMEIDEPQEDVKEIRRKVRRVVVHIANFLSMFPVTFESSA